MKKEDKKIKKAHIKEYSLICDAFGPIPVFTLQHPTKHAQDAFWVMNPEDESKSKNQTNMHRMFLALGQLSDLGFAVYVTADIEYETDDNKEDPMRIVVDMRNIEMELMADSCEFHWFDENDEKRGT